MVLLAGFSGFCVWLFLSVSDLRGELEGNVGELSELQKAQRAPADAPLPAAELARIDARIRALRGASADVSRTLWRRWKALYLIVAAAVAIGIANLLLLVVAHRRRARAEESERALAQHFDVLRRTAERLADGDLATAVAEGEEEGGEFEYALEHVRRDLVDRISELSARNVEIEALADDLRAQIRETSSHLEVSAVRDMHQKDSFAPGAVFAERYRIVKPIGAGGVGDVYEVERTGDKVRCALKLLRRVRNAQHRARFAREAKLLADLNHDNIVAIHHIGVSPGGAMFLIMDLVPGANLAQRKDRHGDTGFLVPVLERVALALAAMHETGLVHRDIKPANIVVADDPATTKLVDFGIAREMDSADMDGGTADTGDTLAAFHTQVGLRVGTPMYMAPELAEPDVPAQAPADVFALGVTAYKLLALRAPFAVPPVDAGDEWRAPTELAELCPDLRGDVADMVMRSLALLPKDRPSAAELAGACAAEATAADA